MANRMTTSEREELLSGLFESFLKRLSELVTSKTATSTDMQLIYKVLQDNGVPMSDLRKALGVDEDSEGDKTFLASLPFPKAAV